MKRLIKWRDYFLNEGVIIPPDLANIKGVIEKNWDSIEDLNKELFPYRVCFMTIEDFRESLKTEKEKEFVPQLSLFAAYHVYLKKMVIIYGISSEAMLDGLKTPHVVNNIIKMLDHEWVHMSQDERSGGNAYSLERSPVKDMEEYFSHHSEVMAYARTLVKEMRDKGLSDLEIKERIKKGNVAHWIYSHYMGIGGKVWLRFKKAVYQYLDI